MSANNHNKARKPKRTMRRVYERFIRIRGRPREVGLGFALGLFIGMTPTIGLQIVISVFMASLLKWSKITAAAGVWITNPFTAPFIYTINYMVGAKILGIEKIFEFSGEPIVSYLFQKAPQILAATALGGIILGIPLAIVGFTVAYLISRRIQKKIRRPSHLEKESSPGLNE